MLYSDLRRAILNLCLAVMDVAWFTPLFLILWPYPVLRPVTVFALLWSGLVAGLLLLDLLNILGVEPPLYHLVVVALILLCGPMVVRVWLYRDVPLMDLSWLRQSVLRLNPLGDQTKPELVLLLTNLFLWQRATWATHRRLRLSRVALTFRLELLLLVLCGSLFQRFSQHNDLLIIVWFFLGCGMFALTLARTYERSLGFGTRGAYVSRRWMLRLATITAVVVLLSVALWTSLGGTFVGFVVWLAPLWRVLFTVAQAVFVLLAMIALDIVRLMRNLLAGLPPPDLAGIRALIEVLQRLLRGFFGRFNLTLPQWLPTVLAVLLLVVAAAAMMGLIVLFLRLIRSQPLEEDEDEEAERDTPELRANLWGWSLAQLRELARLLRRYGLSWDLLAAISVKNIYANVCRLARRRGYPRHPAQPPDAYLAELVMAFGGYAERLGRLTEAYMRVHYGDRPVSEAELRQLRLDYEAIRHNTA